MRLILDTHILLWWWDDSPGLTQDLRDLIADSAHEVFVSAVSIAEIAVKKSIGRLVVGDDFAEGIERDGFAELPLRAAHAARLASLPLLHRDPFDRMLVAQAQVEGATLITVDSMVQQYDVKTLPDGQERRKPSHLGSKE
ncbi:type II toxin-antitoxin system VapC family toxin [Nocardioides sp.]|uniref:type II toxin-antitoxin system VapC family toxin n=1 Tax=Nocardioides sp. TaxID=35761 RepID=UPI002C4D551A|nr:type II toxin-antitoxin system VapC family toxin [Nocardioides sp.]HVX55477.1 type II toxin-antitoxin system VapC family toxin [Nocardioides sp.]